MIRDTRQYRVDPVTGIGGRLSVPGDKSISHRALLLGAIADGSTRVDGFLASEDCLATLQALEALGVHIERPAPTQVRVHGVGIDGLSPPRAALDMGNSGTAMRLLMGVLAGQPFESTLIGDASLSRRPMERVARPLRAMGARIQTLDGHPPVHVHGRTPLQPIDYALPVASAQVKSAVLLAALRAQGQSSVIEPATTRDHTERMLSRFGVPLECRGSRVALRGGVRLRACDIDVPGDFSSAAFFIVAGCLAAHEGLCIERCGVNPTRTGLLELLRLMGADLRIEPTAGAVGSGSAPGSPDASASLEEPLADIHVRASPLHGVRVPESLVPLAIDEFPAFFIAAAAASGETTVTGAGELRVKETDRLAVMAEGLQRLGVDCALLPDGLRVRGAGGVASAALAGGDVDSHGDHRIAMAFAIASVCARGSIRIDDVANVATSFPDFPRLARAVGLALTD